MKNFMLKQFLAFIGRKLNGKKTYAGAAGKIIAGLVAVGAGLVGFISVSFPDQGLPEVPIETAYATFMGGIYGVCSGLQGIGIGHKIEKAGKSEIAPG